MLRIVVVALVILELVLLTSFALAPANATSNEVLENYIWSFADVGSNQVVCKKIVMHPQKQFQSHWDNRQLVQMYSSSTVVSNSYCANLAKPAQVTD